MSWAVVAVMLVAAAETVPLLETPAQHLESAAKLLQAVPVKPLSADARKRLRTLQHDFDALLRTARTTRDRSTPPAEATNWRTKFSSVEFDLAGILGAGNTPAAALESPSATVPVLIAPGSGPVPTPVDPLTPGTALIPDGAPAVTPPEAGIVDPLVGSSPVAGAPTTGLVSGAAIAAGIGVPNLDPNVRRQLERFRSELELFFAASVMSVEGAPPVR